MKKLRTLAVIVFFAILFSNGCAPSGRIGVTVQKPAAIHLAGVKEIAVVDFRGPQGSGGQVATLLQSWLMESQFYTVVEREKLNRIMDEQNLAMTGIVDESTAAEVGKLAGVDALIFGEVTTFQVEPDERGVEKVQKKEGTGRYEMVDEKNIFTGKTKKVKKEIMRTVLVDQHYRIRRGTVAIHFRVVGVETGQLLAVHSDSKSYISGKVIEGSYQTLKPEGEILNDLAQTICQHFMRLIAPYHAIEYRQLESRQGRNMPYPDCGKKHWEPGSSPSLKCPVNRLPITILVLHMRCWVCWMRQKKPIRLPFC
jgi:curli biogenesis system outer membrane secretion channel CsgG